MVGCGVGGCLTVEERKSENELAIGMEKETVDEFFLERCRTKKERNTKSKVANVDDVDDR